jgi:hypothetical protein
MKGIQIAPGDTDECEQQAFFNRSGGATVEGEVYTRDIKRSATESTTVRTALSNLVDPATANLAQPIAVAQGVVADDDSNLFVTKGRCKALVNGTTDVAAGDYLKTTNGSNAFSKATFAVGSVEFAYARALEAQTADSNVLIEVEIFDAPVCQNAAVS